LLGASVLILIGCASWFALSPREPVYEGKALSYWLDEINRTGKTDKNEPAMKAARAMGTNSLPFLLSYIEHKESPIKVYLAKMAQKHPSMRSQFLELDPLLAPSLRMVLEIGPEAKPLIPDFLKLLEDKELSWRGETGLWAIGPEANPALEQACRNTNAVVRVKAAVVLARIRAQERIGDVIVGDGWAQGWNMSTISGRRLFDLGSAFTEQVFGALKRNLKHRDPAVRRATAEATKNAGRHAKEITPALVQALSDEDPSVRAAAAESLKGSDPEAAAKAGVK